MKFIATLSAALSFTAFFLCILRANELLNKGALGEAFFFASLAFMNAAFALNGLTLL